jgi:hypothetical protein
LLQAEYKKVAEVGVHWVRWQWKELLGKNPTIVPRKSPLDTDYDVHINVAMCWQSSVSVRCRLVYRFAKL